jgi:hypothetical protein
MKTVKQRVSYATKAANDFQWGKDNISGFSMYESAYPVYSPNASYGSSRLDMMLRSYRLYNNEINSSDFEEELNPFGFNIGQRKDKIMPYNKAHNKINVLIGELLKRPFNYKAVFTNIEGAYAVRDERMRLVKEYVISEIQKEGELSYLEGQNLAPEELQTAQQQIEQKYAGVMNPEQIDEYLSKTYAEPREVKSNKILANLVKKLAIQDKKKDSFKHGLLSDEEHCWVGVVNGKPCLKVLNPLGVVFQKSPEVKYVQDGSFAGYRTVMSLADIFDTYKNLKAADIKKLEELYTTASSSGGGGGENYNFPHIDLQYQQSANQKSYGSYGIGSGEDIEVFHCEWRSQRKIGFFTYIDDAGEVQTDMVDENFKLDKEDPTHVSIEWDWVPEIWEGTKIGAGMDSEAVYVDIQPVPYQEIDIEDPYSQPLRYHGVTYNNMNTHQISTMERMRPFQFLFFIVMHRMKHLLSRDRGKVMPVDVSKLDPRYNLEETLFYLDEMDVFIHNSLSGAESPGAAHRSGLDNGIDRSNAQHIINYINILNYLDEQIGEVAGVTRAREGQTSPYDAVTNTQQSIMQSSTITELLYSVHTCHWERVLNSLLDLAIRVDNEKGGVYSSIESDFTKTVYNVKKGEMDNCKFNVFVVDNPKDNEVFRQIQGLAQPLLQNDKARFSQIIKLLKQSYSIEELTKDIEAFEAQIDRQNEERYQQEQQLAKQQSEDLRNVEMMRMNHEMTLNQQDNETKVKVAEIQAFMGQMDQDSNDNQVPDQLEIERLKHEVATSQQDRVMEDKKLNSEKEENQKDRELKREEMKSKERIAKSKPKPKTGK